MNEEFEIEIRNLEKKSNKDDETIILLNTLVSLHTLRLLNQDNIKKAEEYKNKIIKSKKNKTLF